ncbi:DUF4838 domain-containing protein [Parabacteroides sp. W1-Q-101]|uniref:DUF4838 domain-containing protein n=1 Tax=Parabacteroides TaxID=375288 RepID=UPI00202DD9D8|nr:MULTISPECIES: DUF4838 domain-containing protein [Parabacteroides]MCM0720279.1 DUF4838 domain-containing protein [Parabacteroides sp. W1-Q-101]
MKNYLIVGGVAVMSLLLSCQKGPLILADQGQSEYVIVVSPKATESEQHAAHEFSRLLALSSGVTLPVVLDTEAGRRHEILIGASQRTDIDTATLGEDGFTIRTEGSRLAIVGGKDKGTLYGVYSFFDQYLGYRCLSSKVLDYPKLKQVEVGKIDDTQVPVNQFRDTHYRDAFDPFYSDWHKIDHCTLDGVTDGEWGYMVHTFELLVPPSLYFKTHPEYYALIDGKRNTSQLCLSNPDVFDVLVRNLEEAMGQFPNASYWSVSQNDNYGYCQCEKCAAMDEQEGSHSGSILAFVNRVAERFPDKMISTLAYQYSRKPPRTIVPRENVQIMLCDIESERQKPIATNPDDNFGEDLRAWGKLTRNIMIWDYVVQFRNLVSPFPNLRVLQPNIQFFVENGTNAHFQQGNREIGGEFYELRQYLISRLLWNPDCDVEAEMDDFLKHYYREAAPYIRQYIDIIHDESEASGEKLGIFMNPEDYSEKGFLRDELMERYEALFQQAMEAVSGQPDILLRVKVAHMPLTYALFNIAKKRGTSEGRCFEQVNGKWQVRPEMITRLDEFVELCRKTGVTRLSEWHTTPDEYDVQMHEFFQTIH